MILDRQRTKGWGTRVIERLSRDLQAEFPGQQGFSPGNLTFMRAFADAWPATNSKSKTRAKLEVTTKSVDGQARNKVIPVPMPIVQAPLAQLSWYHHLALLDKLDNPAQRLWYAAAKVENGWSRNILALQIESGLHLRQGKAVPSVQEIEQRLSEAEPTKRAVKPLRKK